MSEGWDLPRLHAFVDLAEAAVTPARPPVEHPEPEERPAPQTTAQGLWAHDYEHPLDVVEDPALPPGTFRLVPYRVATTPAVIEDTVRMTMEWDRNMIALRIEEPKPLTEEERAALDARRREYLAARDGFIARMHAASPLVAALVDLHRPDGDSMVPDCVEESDEDGGYTPWPCPTVRLAAEHAGIALPSQL